mmetsp:Transcript_50731/g.162340  ORF Transcript_50731/g.162340 Transcript_50731/m.162340 type:complete len:398 (+) Transcript_50731:62-1255(+)
MGGSESKQERNFDHGVKALLKKHSIEPWHARNLIKDKLQLQLELARDCPLRQIPVEEGLAYFRSKCPGPMGKEVFVELSMELLKSKAIWTTPKHTDDLHHIFDSMDFDRSGSLDSGEWAGGLTVFFKGDTAQCVHAVFSTLDRDGNGKLSKAELSEYLKPVVKAMVPKEAEPLQPLLLSKSVDHIYAEMDEDTDGGVTSDEMLAWTRKGNNLVDKLSEVINGEVYRLWLHNREQDRRAGVLPSKSSSSTKPVSSPDPSSTQQGGQAGTQAPQAPPATTLSWIGGGLSAFRSRTPQGQSSALPPEGQPQGQAQPPQSGGPNQPGQMSVAAGGQSQGWQQGPDWQQSQGGPQGPGQAQGWQQGQGQGQGSGRRHASQVAWAGAAWERGGQGDAPRAEMP